MQILGCPVVPFSSAYQCGCFAARAILAFLGVSIAELGKVSIVADLCRNMQGIRPQRMADLGAFDENASFHSIGVLFDHRQIWLLFQRILRISTCSIWPEGWANYFSNLDIGQFTKQRHGLHYHLGYWVEADIHEFTFPLALKKVAPTGEGRNFV